MIRSGYMCRVRLLNIYEVVSPETLITLWKPEIKKMAKKFKFKLGGSIQKKLALDLTPVKKKTIITKTISKDMLWKANF